MRKHFTTPFSLGLICGAMASVCWALPHVRPMLPYPHDWRHTALAIAVMFGGPLFLALPGFLLSRRQDRYAGLFVSVAIGGVLLVIPHAFTKPPSFGPVAHCYQVQMATTGIFILMTLSLFRPSQRGAGCVVLATLLSLAGAVGIAAGAIAFVPMRYGCYELTLPEAVIIVLVGPWLGTAMWSVLLPKREPVDAQGSDPPAGGGE